MNEELKDGLELKNHSDTYDKFVCLDANNDAWLFRKGEGSDAEQQLLAATVRHPPEAPKRFSFWAIDMFHLDKYSGNSLEEMPVFPLTVLANR